MKVSVVMITYLHGKYIEEAILSILDQKCSFDVELIIANDNSPDNTDIIIQKLLPRSTKHISIKYIKRKLNLGMMPNFRDALSKVSGEFIALCDGDDYWTDPFKLQKQVDLLEKNTDSSMCVALHCLLSSEKLTPETRNEHEDGIKLNFPSVHNRYFHTTTYLIRNASLQIILKKYRELFIGDTALRYLLSAEGSFVLLNDHVSVYRLSGTGIWTSLNDFEKAFAHYNLYSKLRKKHIRTRNSYYLNHEIDYLKSMLEVSEKKDLFYLLKYKYLLLLKNKKTYYPTVKNLKRIIKQIIRK